MGLFHFLNHILHIFRRHELAFLHVHRLACHGSAIHKVCLPAEEGRNLQHIQHFGCRRQLGNVMDIGEHRYLQFFFDVRQDFQSFFKARSPEGMVGRTVCFVIGRFENVLHTKAVADFLDFPSDHQGSVVSFNNAGAGDEEKFFPIQGKVSYMDCFHKWFLSKYSLAFFKSASVSMPISSVFTGMTPILYPISRARSCSRDSVFSRGVWSIFA